MTPLTDWSKAQLEAKKAQDKVVHAIVEALPEKYQVFKGEILDEFAADPNSLVDWLADMGIYRARVPYRISGNRTVIISEPMDSVNVPRLEHTYGGHPLARVEIVD